MDDLTVDPTRHVNKHKTTDIHTTKKEKYLKAKKFSFAGGKSKNSYSEYDASVQLIK